jgi:NAD(P)-dependent dehydrogenase (short-subunit alcohol dehydrogenase family)
MLDLTGKVIVITGASSGIGRAAAMQCAEQGATIILMGRNNERLNHTSENLKGNHHFILEADITDYESIESKLKSIIASSGKLSGLINAAGITTTLPLTLSKPEKMDTFFKVNVTAAINLTRLCVSKQMLSENGGSIIFLASVMGLAGEVGKTIYSATKGALISASRSLALELAAKNVRVNCISPGVVITPMTQNAVYNRDEEARAKILALHPLGLGRPEDIASACVFLLSDEARWITGSNLIIDGGYTAR